MIRFAEMPVLYVAYGNRGPISGLEKCSLLTFKPGNYAVQSYIILNFIGQRSCFNLLLDANLLAHLPLKIIFPHSNERAEKCPINRTSATTKSYFQSGVYSYFLSFAYKMTENLEKW